MEIKNRRLNPGCSNASNPFHECGEYCAGGKPRAAAAPGSTSNAVPSSSLSSPAAAQNGARSEAQQGKHGSGRTKMVDASCPNASNPFHQCSDYCSRRAPEAIRRPTGQERSVGNSMRVVDTRKVDPACPNASNPFHVCTEHCSQRRHARTHSDGSFTLRERKNELKTGERTEVNPNCANASNPFHKCSDYCLQRMNAAS